MQNSCVLTVGVVLNHKVFVITRIGRAADLWERCRTQCTQRIAAFIRRKDLLVDIIRLDNGIACQKVNGTGDYSRVNPVCVAIVVSDDLNFTISRVHRDRAGAMVATASKTAPINTQIAVRLNLESIEVRLVDGHDKGSVEIPITAIFKRAYRDDVISVVEGEDAGGLQFSIPVKIGQYRLNGVRHRIIVDDRLGMCAGGEGQPRHQQKVFKQAQLSK